MTDKIKVETDTEVPEWLEAFAEYVTSDNAASANGARRPVNAGDSFAPIAKTGDSPVFCAEGPAEPVATFHGMFTTVE